MGLDEDIEFPHFQLFCSFSLPFFGCFFSFPTPCKYSDCKAKVVGYRETFHMKLYLKRQNKLMIEDIKSRNILQTQLSMEIKK